MEKSQFCTKQVSSESDSHEKLRSMLQGAVTHARRTSPHLNTKYKKLNRNKKKFKKKFKKIKEFSMEIFRLLTYLYLLTAISKKFDTKVASFAKK